MLVERMTTNALPTVSAFLRAVSNGDKAMDQLLGTATETLLDHKYQFAIIRKAFDGSEPIRLTYKLGLFGEQQI